jgi:hypothetical protein
VWSPLVSSAVRTLALRPRPPPLPFPRPPFPPPRRHRPPPLVAIRRACGRVELFLSPSSPPHRLCSSLRSSATLCRSSSSCQPLVVTELRHPLLVLNRVAVPERSLLLSCACELSRRLGSAPPRTSPSLDYVEPPLDQPPPWHTSPHFGVPRRPLRTVSLSPSSLFPAGRRAPPWTAPSGETLPVLEPKSGSPLLELTPQPPPHQPPAAGMLESTGKPSAGKGGKGSPVLPACGPKSHSLGRVGWAT